MSDKERDIKKEEVDVFGDEKMAVRRMTTPRGIAAAVITIYGFVSFLNPERYPILGVLVKNTSYAERFSYEYGTFHQSCDSLKEFQSSIQIGTSPIFSINHHMFMFFFYSFILLRNFYSWGVYPLSSPPTRG